MTIKTPWLCLAVILAACSGQPNRSSAQAIQGGFDQADRQPPSSAASMKMSFAPVVRRAAPAVVNVYSRRTVRQQADPFWQLFGAGVPRDRVEQSLGSGVIVRPDGIIVTNNHVVEGGQQIMVAMADRREFPAKVLLANSRADVAVLKIDPGSEKLPVLPIQKRDDVQVGDLVLAIGDPFGVGQTVTNGIVSALARTDVGITDYSFFIQTDAAINPGNSGGPLVNMDGELIGLNTAIFSRSGGSSGVGFAIPAVMVRQVVDAALGGDRSVVRPWLGVKGQTVSAEIASSVGLDRPIGVIVQAVYPGAAAARAGLKPGDVIISVDGQAVNDEAAVSYRVATHRIGDNIPLTVRRGSASLNLTMRAEPPPASPARDERKITGVNPLSGATVANLSPAVADETGVDAFTKGVITLKVDPDSTAAQVGLRPGDIVQGINASPVTGTAQAQSLLTAGSGRWRLTIQRGDRQIKQDFRL